MKQKHGENFKEVLLQYGYVYLEGDYEDSFSILYCFDKDGYIVQVTFNKIENSTNGNVYFHPQNKYTIQNIIHYLELHPELKCKYHSGEYKGAKSKLTFECNCGNLFTTTFQNVRYKHKYKCDDCTGHHGNLTYEKVKNDLIHHGYNLIVPKNEFKRATTTDLICTDDFGYKYIVKYDAIMSGKKAEIFSPFNPFTIENINLYLDKYSQGEYSCISKTYEGSRSDLLFRHNKCNRTFVNKWANVHRQRCLSKLGTNKTGAFCPFCDAKQLESTHALVLKQVWLHEKDGTIVEDKSCINPNTNCHLPTDIVNHIDKVAIEVQSWFHDFEDQKAKDRIKREYWISRGYKFYALDQRDYTVLEMIQFFFPYISSIPSYVDFEYSNKINDVLAQKLLNDGYSVTEVANEINCKPHQIYDAIQYGRITYPDNYKNACYTPIVQLSLNKDFISRYDCIADASRATNIPAGNIVSTLLDKRSYANGYYWVYEKDYLSGDYKIVEPRFIKFMIPVDRYDMNDNFICHFDTILDASKDCKSTNFEIYEVVNGIRKSSYGYKYKKVS